MTNTPRYDHYKSGIASENVTPRLSVHIFPETGEFVICCYIFGMAIVIIKQSDSGGIFQFSVFDLHLNQINRQYVNEHGDIQVIDVREDYTPAVSGNLWIELVYELYGPEFEPLDPFGQPRQFVFVVGDIYINAEMGPDGRLTFEDPDQIAQLEAEDYLLISLFQESDMANSLWEFALTTKPDLEMQSLTEETEPEPNEETPGAYIGLSTPNRENLEPLTLSFYRVCPTFFTNIFGNRSRGG